jgi:hypothetical protein
VEFRAKLSYINVGIYWAGGGRGAEGKEYENGENSLMRRVIIFAKRILFGRLRGGGEMGGTYGTCEGEARCIQDFDGDV